MSTLDMSDEISTIEPNISVNVEPVDEPEDEVEAEPEVAEPEPEVAEPEPEVAEPEEPEPEVAEPEPEVAEPDESAADEPVEPDDFEEYLKSIGFERFTNKFKENGYDSVESLKNISKSDIHNIAKTLHDLIFLTRQFL